MRSVRVSTKYSLFHFCLLTVPYHSKFKKIFRVDSKKKSILGFGWNLGSIWKFVKCSLLPFLFTYFDLSSSKSLEKYWPDSENKVNNYFDQIFIPYSNFGMFFQEKHFFLNIMSLQYAKTQMVNERERNQSHYSTSVVAIGLLILG